MTQLSSNKPIDVIGDNASLAPGYTLPPRPDPVMPPGTENVAISPLRILMYVAWITLAGVMVFLAAQPVSLDAQMWMAITLLGALGIFRMVGLSKGMFRPIFAAVAAFIVLRYIFWRTMQTIPPVEEFANFIPAILLFGAEIYAISMLIIGIFVIIDPLKRKAAPLIGPPENYPTVDVFVPSYNEDTQILEATLIAAKHMRYPKGRMEVHLLDDGGTVGKRNQADPAKALEARQRHEELKALCAQLGVTYRTRERNNSAKAGNINAALPDTDGELIVILDADHVPTVEFLEKTVGYFQRDTHLFLVQTPHFFINPDPLERNLSTFDRMPSENEMFYGIIQPGLDRWNSAYFCGSAAVLRRSCLEEIGGISGNSITEDAETALELHSRGYNSVYVEEPLVAGLQPETFDAFIRQRTRWAQGMTQIMVLKTPLFKRGLSFSQRICYTSSAMFWLFPFARLLFILTPLVYLFFGLQFFKTSVPEFLVFTVPYIMVCLMVANSLYGTVRWPFVSELYEYVQSIFTWKAVLGAMISPKHPKFAVTDKGVTLEEDMLSPLARPLIFIVGILSLGLAFGAYRYMQYPLERDVIMVVCGWTFLNLFLALAGLGVACEGAQRRTNPRMPTWRKSRMVVDGVEIEGAIDDLSSSGMRMTVPASLVRSMTLVGKKIEVLVEPFPGASENSFQMDVRSARPLGANMLIGLAFAPRSQEEREHAFLLFYGDSRQWKAFLGSRRHHMGLLRGMFLFFKLSGYYSVYSLKFVWRIWARSGKQYSDSRMQME
ncbi:MAG: UDP-forming cellulose synthase catalytic subunit [Rhodospirillaceae bacterium]